MDEMPEWLRKRPPLTDEEIREGVDAARRYLARSTPNLAVETQRLIVALATKVKGLEAALVTIGELLEETGRERRRLQEALEERDQAAWERSERDA